MKTLLIPPDLQEIVKQHARIELPRECVGVLAGFNHQVSEIFPLVNIHTTPTKSYNAWPEQLAQVQRLLPRLQLDMIAVYHSHPTADLKPSKSDMMFAFSPELVYLITDGADLKGWHIDGEKSTEVSIIHNRRKLHEN